MIELIEQTINKIDDLIKEQLPESKYQFELYDLNTNTKHFRGYDEPFHWGSVYKLFVVAEIIKMSEEGLFKMDDEIELHKQLYTHGNGIMKSMTHLKKLSYLDACKMVISSSDNLCADELLNIVTIERVNKLFKIAKCTLSKLTDNLDTLVRNLFSTLPKSLNSTYIFSDEFYSYYDFKLKQVLLENYCSVSNVNTCFHFISNGYLNPTNTSVFKDCLMGVNVWTRLNYYCYFSQFGLKGKTGTLGFGITNNETVSIIRKSDQIIVGYFTINTKNNKVRYQQSNDILGLIGLEIANLYEQLDKQTK